MTPLLVPLLVQQFVGQENQGTYYGILRLWTLMTAILVQSLMGMVSDHSQAPWGRRKPFILAGMTGVLFVLVLIGFSSSMHGMAGYWVFFSLVVLQMAAINTAHGAIQGLIPDLVPEDKRGRFSGIKALLEAPIPVILVSLTIARLVAAGHLWWGILTLVVILIFTTGITMLVPEEKHLRPNDVIDWSSFIRLAIMTGTFAGIILAIGKLSKLVIGFIHWSDPSVAFVGFLTIGALAMGAIILLGVYLCTRIGLGKHERDHSSFTWWVINRLAFLAGSTNVLSFTIYFLQERFGFAGEKAAGPAATLTQFVGVFIFISALPSGWLSDRLGTKKMVFASGLLAVLGTTLIVFAPSLTFLYIGGILLGIAVGQFYSSNWALGTRLVPKEEAGKYLGISNLAGAGAGAVGAYIGGPLADAFRLNLPSANLAYTVLFSIFAILFLVSTLAILKVKRVK